MAVRLQLDPPSSPRPLTSGAPPGQPFLALKDLELTSDPRKVGGEVVIEGGSLLLASGGVCVTGDLGRLRKDKLHKLQHSEGD